jgi:hypothetical protein
MNNVTKRIALHPPFASQVLHRGFSVKAIYSSFPVTLLYYSPHRKLGLYDEEEVDNRADDIYEGRAKLKDGLVFPCESMTATVGLASRCVDKR